MSRLRPRLAPAAWVIVAWGVTLLVVALTRPLVSMDEVRYMSVAWELFDSGQSFLLTLNTEPYLHKPPLLFWLVEAGWWLAGVDESWPRLLPVLLHGLTLWVVAGLASRLWPAEPGIGATAAMVYVGFAFPSFYATTLSFDAMVVLGVVTAAAGLWLSPRCALRGWGLYMLGLGFGMLAKGPIVYLYLTPALLFAPVWATRPVGGWIRWYASGLGATVLSMVAIAIWLVPLASVAGPDVVAQLIEEQVLGRIDESVTQGMIGHHRPVYWYLMFLPLVVLPWLFWGPIWHGLKERRADHALRFVGVVIAGSILTLSLISNKQVHYLLPVLALGAPALAAALMYEQRGAGLVSRGLVAVLLLGFAGLLAYASGPGSERWGEWLADIHPLWLVLPAAAALAVLVFGGRRHGAAVVAASPVLLLFTVMVGIAGAGRDHYDLHGTARVLADAVEEDRPLAYLGNYQGQFHFLGRIPHDVEIVELFAGDVPGWLEANPDGLLITRTKRVALEDDLPVFHRQPYRSGELLVIEAEALASEQTEFRNCWPRFQTCDGEAPAFEGGG